MNAAQLRLLDVKGIPLNGSHAPLLPGPIICLTACNGFYAESKWYRAEHLRLNRGASKRSRLAKLRGRHDAPRYVFHRGSAAVSRSDSLVASVAALPG